MFASAEVQTEVLELSPAGSAGPAWDRGPISDIEPTRLARDPRAAWLTAQGSLPNTAWAVLICEIGRAHV